MPSSEDSTLDSSIGGASDSDSEGCRFDPYSGVQQVTAFVIALQQAAKNDLDAAFKAIEEAQSLRESAMAKLNKAEELAIELARVLDGPVIAAPEDIWC